MKELRIMKWQWLMALFVAFGTTLGGYGVIGMFIPEERIVRYIFFAVGIVISYLSVLVIPTLQMKLRKDPRISPLDWKHNLDKSVVAELLMLHLFVAIVIFAWQDSWLSIVGVIFVNMVLSKWFNFRFVDTEKLEKPVFIKKKKRNKKKRR